MADKLYLPAISGIIKPRHNPTNFDAYIEAQHKADEGYAKIERERLIQERTANLQQWDQSLAERWKGSSLTKIKNPAAAEIIELIDKHGQGSVFITGNAGAGKTFISYGVIRRYIGKGWTSYPQVKVVSEESIMGLGFMGFEGRHKLEKLLDRKYNTYFFDNVGERRGYDRAKEMPIWERIIDHIYSNSLNAVFASNYALEGFLGHFSDSGQSKLRSMIGQRCVAINGANNSIDSTDLGARMPAPHKR